MSCFFDIFNPSFFIFLGLLMLFLACLILYFESKWREQNHKISSMVSLVSSLAEEVNHTKLVLSTLNMQHHSQNPIRHSVYNNNDSNSNVKDELIPVSDEEDGEDGDEDEDEDEDGDGEDDGEDGEDDGEDGVKDVIGGSGLREIKSILFDKTMHHANMKLNEIDLNDEEEEEEDKDESMLFSQGAPISLNQIMASIFQNAHMVPFRNQQDLEEVDEPVEELIEPEEPCATQLEQVEPSVEFQDIKSIDLSSINISNEPLEPSEKPVKKVKKGKEVKQEIEEIEEKEETEETDFKKMSIQKLRTIVLEKQLSLDPSKMKKQELLKLLEG